MVLGQVGDYRDKGGSYGTKLYLCPLLHGKAYLAMVCPVDHRTHPELHSPRPQEPIEAVSGGLQAEAAQLGNQRAEEEGHRSA